MGFISKSIFKDILSLVLQNCFADIEQLSDPQIEALFGISESRGCLRHLTASYQLAMENPSYSSAFQIFADNYC